MNFWKSLDVFSFGAKQTQFLVCLEEFGMISTKWLRELSTDLVVLITVGNRSASWYRLHEFVRVYYKSAGP